MPEPQFSVGIPFRNPGPYFARAIQSVFAQTLTDWELILVDDGSQDGAVEYARRISDPRVRVEVDGQGRGLAPRLNQIAHLARAPYLARMDADDLMHPQRLEVQLGMLTNAAGPLVLGSCAYAIDTSDRATGFKRTFPRSGYQAKHAVLHPSVAAPTAWFRAHPYSEDPAFLRCEDAELWTRSIDTTTFQVCDQALLYYREVGVFSLSNYRATQRGVAELVRRRFAHPWPRRYARLMALQGRTMLVRALAGLGLADAWVRLRSRALTPAQASAAASGLDRIRAATVPLAGPP